MMAVPLVVVKIGGGLSTMAGALDRTGAALADAAARHRIVVIPGGGPFADLVREFEGRVGLTPDAAHWMAILGMDQYAHAIASHTPGAVVVDEAGQLPAAHAAGRLPVLAPSRWLRAADELPHGWEVTSDSLAAYLARRLESKWLILVKPVAGEIDRLVDPYFRRAVAPNLNVTVIGADGIDRLGRILDAGAGRREG